MIPSHPSTSAVDWDAKVSLKLLVESAPIALAIVNRQGQMLYVNTKLEELFGYRREEILGKPVEVLMPLRFHAAHVQHRAGYMQHPHERLMGSGLDLAGRRKDGSEFPLEAGLSTFTTDDEVMVIATVTDLSKRKQTEELLEQRVEERTREIERRQRVSDGLGDILAMINSNYALEEVFDHIAKQAMDFLNAQASAISLLQEENRQLVTQVSHGYLANELRYTHLPLDEENFNGVAIRRGQPIAVRDLAHTRQGDEPTLMTRRQWLIDRGCQALLAVPFSIKEVVSGCLVLYYRQGQDFAPEAIELAQTLGNQAALAVENARLRTQIERSAVSAERSRLARDLHDAVTQTLFSTSMIAEVLPRIWRRNPAEGERRLAELHELTRGALAEMRTLLLELRPAKLIEVGMADLLRQLAEAIAGRARLAVDVQIEGQTDLPVDIKVALYRIAQEALNNIAKHAQAQQAVIHLRSLAEKVELTISDDGCGFVFERIGPEHLGLGIMRERADDIGATLSVQTQPRQGTTIQVCWNRHDGSALPNRRNELPEPYHG